MGVTILMTEKGRLFTDIQQILLITQNAMKGGPGKYSLPWGRVGQKEADGKG